MRRYLVAGNWKMNTTLASARAWARALAAGVPRKREAVEVLACPPFPYLLPVAEAIAGSGVVLGAQNAYHEPPGAFTGETAVEMLLDVGCQYVILGHSERRHVLEEDDDLINRKVHAAVKKGLKVILCVGELLSEREAGKTESVLDRQMERGLAGIDAGSLALLVVAYEPVWAIGTGVNATPAQAESAHAHLRNWLLGRYNADVAEGMRILYGGSVKADNAAELLAQPNVNGALVGGASLKTESFLPIVDAAVRLAEH
ncbi:MAG: triose-phosphate isomerase [Planctomycetaceae bacterium]